MDPLGAVSDVIVADDITRWSQALSDVDPLSEASNAMSVLGPDLPYVHKTPPFTIRPDLNDKVAFMVGDISKLSLEAVVNPTNESLTDKNPISIKLLDAAGQELRDDLKNQVISCRTGDAKITAAYALPARHVIHTVGPRYNVKYKTAAESALYNCYRSVLQMTKSRSITSVAIPTLVSCRRNYPPVEGAHIALRTIRRFLEHYGEGIDLILIIADQQDLIYQQMFSLFFPRTPEEENFSMRALPLDLGNELGEPIITERQIRIADQPIRKRSMSNEDNENKEVDDTDDDSLMGVGQHPFAMMTTSKDTERKEALSKQRAAMTEEEERARRYQQFLRMSRTENFSDLTATGAFYRAGIDYQGNQVVVFVDRLFPAPKYDLNKAVAYFVSIMEPIVRRPFVFVYMRTDPDVDTQLDAVFIKELYALVDSRYKNHLRHFIIIHSNFWFKMSSWWFLTWNTPEIKEKVVHLSGVEYLYDFINPQQINVPQFVKDHDKQINGSNYYKATPKTQKSDNTQEEL